MRSIFCGSAIGALSLSSPALAAPTFTEIARKFTEGLVWLNADLRPALADDGTVAFVGSADFSVYDGDVIFSGDGATLSAQDPASYDLSNLASLRIDPAGHIALVADRAASGGGQRGVYTTSTLGGSFATLFESPYPPLDPASAFISSNVALSPNGTVAFATIRNGAGAIYRGSVSGPFSQLRSGSGGFYNVRELDVNDAGQVPVQMEYFDPTAGLSRGILLFDAPEQTLADIDTAIERLPIGMQPMPAINASGQVAFALGGSVDLLFFDPPGVYSSPPAYTLHLEPGVYVATPTPWGEPTVVELVAGTAGPYASFSKVDISDSGLVVFEATLDDGGFGVFTGPNPALHKVVAVGDVIDGALFSWLRLGELNNAGELSLMTSDYYSTDRQVWRVSDLPQPLRIRRVWPWLRVLLPRQLWPFPPR